MQYTIKNGDSLYSIAQQYGVSVSAILAANPQITNSSMLYVGQVITIPQVGEQIYTVKPGDSLFSIAKKFGVTVNSILAANPQIADPNSLFVGQQIRIPVGKPPEQPIIKPTAQYGYNEMGADIKQLEKKYPFLKFQSVGKSVEGRDLYVVRLGIGQREVHYQGAIHANEWITTPVLMKFIEDYAQAYTQNKNLNGYNIRQLYNQVSVWIMPMANPDGVELVIRGISPSNPYYNSVIAANDSSTNFDRWKANIRGVDLNDQFPAFWEEEKARTEVDRPYYRDYPGPYPFSEPESRTMGNFTYSHNFRLIVAVHTQGEVIYWGYRGYEPAVSRVIAENMARVSGYQPIQYVVSDAGYRDWFILEWRRPGFTVEVGRGINPLPISQFPIIYSKVLPILLYAAVA